jgi:hypothetical protein
MPKENNYIIEYVKLGTYVKVSAIDTDTATEACVILPAQGLTQNQMRDLAIKRLHYVMRREEGEAGV